MCVVNSSCAKATTTNKAKETAHLSLLDRNYPRYGLAALAAKVTAIFWVLASQRSAKESQVCLTAELHLPTLVVSFKIKDQLLMALIYQSKSG